MEKVSYIPLFHLSWATLHSEPSRVNKPSIVDCIKPNTFNLQHFFSDHAFYKAFLLVGVLALTVLQS